MLPDYSLPDEDTVHLGTFVKTPAPQIIEILGLSGLDFVVVDAEHAPFDYRSLDAMALAARAAQLPLLVRVPDQHPSTLSRTLDLGVNGVLVPHVDTAEQAAAVVLNCRHMNGARGYSGSPRSSSYGALGMKQALALSDRTIVLCQIESELAVEQASAIAQVDGVHGLFIGRADLALSMRLNDPNHPKVKRAAESAISAALQCSKLAAAFVGSREERVEYMQAGVRWFVQGSDQSLLRAAAKNLRN